MRKFLIFLLLCIFFGLAPGRAANLPMDNKVVLSAFLSLSELHFNQILSQLRILAAGNEIQSGEWEKMTELLHVFKGQNLPAVSWFCYPDGTYYIAEMGKAAQNINDRPYFSRLLDGKEVIGELLVSKSTGKKSMVIAVPVRRNGGVIGALGVSIFLEDLSRILLREMQLPKDMLFYALNAGGETALHSDVKWLMEKPALQRNKALSKAVKEIMASDTGQISYEFEGVTRQIIFKKSDFLGWKFVIGYIDKK